MADVDVVVVNYRTPADLDAFCSTLKLQSADFSAWIVNVSPTIADLEVAKRHSDVFKHVVFHQNVGYGRACNYGASLGTAPIIALFNADVLFPQTNSLGDIVEAMQRNPDWAIVGPRQVNSEGLLTHAGIDGTNKDPAFRAWMSREDFTDTVECVSVMGAAYFARRDVWEELGNCEKYNEWYQSSGLSLSRLGAFLPTPLYYEDMWCSLHARAHGHKVMYYGGTTLVHEWHQSIRKHLNEQQADIKFQEARNFFRSCCRHHGIECE